MGEGIGQKYRYEDFERERIIQDFSITLPEPPPAKEIDNYGRPTKDQKFTPPSREYVKNLSFKLEDKDYKPTPEEEEFINLQWKRREDGYWFFNNGYLEYINGYHYFYLTAWEIVRVEEYVNRQGNTRKRKISGLPTFTDSDRDYFYIWKDVIDDESCFGLIHITNRRDGKTYRATSTLYEAIARTPDSIAGIQSKTDTDGKKIFKKLVKSWKKVPEYFKPVDIGDSDPGKVLEFKNPKSRSTKSQQKKYAKVLESEINYGNAKEEYYDGDGLFMLFHDEVGKTEPKIANVHTRWYIAKETLSDGAEVTGKALLTTTVEDMEKKGGVNCKKLWDDSDVNSEIYEQTGQTKSGLKRYFKPAYYGLRGADKSEKDDKTPSFIDEWGYTNIDAAEAYLAKIEKTLSGEDLISRKRKYPRTIKDCFLVSGKDETFPTHKIYQQLDYNEINVKPGHIRKGNFIWIDRSKHIVDFKDDPKGFFEVSWIPETEMQNRFEYDGRGFPSPLNKTQGVIGVDPFDHKTTVDNRKSDAAASFFKRFDFNNPKSSNCFVMNYVGRRQNPWDFYEEMIMAAVFFGVQLLVENQKPGILNHMNQHGYQNYIYKTRQSDFTKSNSRNYVEGISMAGDIVRQAAINGLIKYIYEFIGKVDTRTQMERFGWKKEDVIDDMMGNCPFNGLMNDWIQFDSSNWTVSDQTVGSMIAILGCNPVRKRVEKEDEEEIKITLDSLIQTHKLR